MTAATPETTPADEHRFVAGGFTALVRGARPDSWDDPAPCEGWVARDVVRHLVEWFPAFLKAGAGIELPRGPSVDEDPVAAWGVHSDGVQALLDDAATRPKVLVDPHIGELPLDQAVDRFYTVDVFMHTWDLARATGQDESPRPGAVPPAPRGDASDGRRAPQERPLRASGRGGGGCRCTDAAPGVHRSPSLATRRAAQ
jgi:uncharacterized protein (TIGR03086 family)